ncbi:hypothetical protein SAMN02745941_01190 [Clostridium intestinale DSM 6191]|uniref:Uncharacterized protein n=1 Tax=Clostridium intestinale DSM 6191 TaxID=1121320 RepID=A0A1M5WPB8_9CLOT|nr:hypothetical protein SAMN02745941_01190 [Clostridium intestinale DSM 6191]
MYVRPSPILLRYDNIFFVYYLVYKLSTCTDSNLKNKYLFHV